MSHWDEGPFSHIYLGGAGHPQPNGSTPQINLVLIDFIIVHDSVPIEINRCTPASSTQRYKSVYHIIPIHFKYIPHTMLE